MLQTNFDGSEIQMTVYNPSLETQNPNLEPLKAPCDKTARMLDLFEEITGWKIEFAESKSSQKRRTDSRRLPSAVSPEQARFEQPAKGTFSIVDMSEAWPPKVPTGHRAKCDQLVGVIDELVRELQSTKSKLVESQSALAGLDPNAKVDEQGLVDSFIPKFGRRSADKIQANDSDEFVLQSPLTLDSDFELSQPLMHASALVAPPFEGWQLGGQTGIAENFYLDWRVDEEEQISIFAGEIESAETAQETKIVIDPLTHEYRIERGLEEEAVADQSNTSEYQTFFLWDSKTSQLQSLTTTSWTRLRSSQAIVATTASKLGDMECWKQLAQAPAGSDDFAAADLAELFRSSLTSNDPLVVLKRI